MCGRLRGRDRFVSQSSLCPFLTPGAQSPRAADHEILRCRVLGFMLDAPDQTQPFISNITDDRVKCSVSCPKCRKVQKRKYSSTSVFRLTTMGNKWPFPILGSCLSFICSICVRCYPHVARGVCLSCKKRRKIEIQTRSWHNGV